MGETKGLGQGLVEGNNTTLLSLIFHIASKWYAFKIELRMHRKHFKIPRIRFIEKKKPSFSIPPQPRSQHRPRRIPRSNNHILILLQPNQPPATDPHSQYHSSAPDASPNDASNRHASFGVHERESHACARSADEEDCEREVQAPGAVA